LGENGTDTISQESANRVTEKQENDRYKTGERYHAVPPPYTKNFLPPKPDLFFTDDTNASESVANMINVDSSEHKTSQDKSKTHRPNAPIIKDWISDSEDEPEIESVPKQREPSFVKSTKHVKTFRGSVKKVEHHKQAKNLRTNNQNSREFKEIDGGYVAFGGNPKGGNQPNDNAGIKENLDAGKVGKETVSAQQYVLLPLWSSDSQDPKNTNDDVADDAFEVTENENDVHVSANENAKTDKKEHDEKDKRDDKGKSHVNAVSEPVNAAGSNPTNNTKSFNTASPFITIDWSAVAEQVKERQSDLGKRYQGLKKKPVSVAQARKNTMIYLKNMADWEIHTEGPRKYWKIIMVGRITEAYQTFEDMLKGFDREDLVALWNLVKERFSSAEPSKDKERALWVELKRLFEPDANNVLWKLQRYMHAPLTWILYSDCGCCLSVNDEKE
nr:hypothetical protein [Tanacetum cinerariifolium]